MTASSLEQDDDLLAVQDAAPLCASIGDFVASLLNAHPALLSRYPVFDRERTALLLLMHLDESRHLLCAYESLAGGDTAWHFDSGVDEGDDIPF